MLTAKEIHDVAFSSSMSGYKKSEVDVFLDECAATIEALTAARADLEKKLEVLADKLVEYRNDEDSIRTALLSAQRLGDTVVREANQKASLILEDARIKADKAADIARQNIREEEAELARIKHEVSEFRNQMLSLYRDHLKLIGAMPEEEPIKEVEPIAEEPVAPVEPEPVVEVPSVDPAAAFEPMEQPTATPPVIPPEAKELVRAVPVLEEEEELVPLAPPVAPTPTHSKFADLKFGDDYDIAKDSD